MTEISCNIHTKKLTNLESPSFLKSVENKIDTYVLLEEKISLNEIFPTKTTLSLYFLIISLNKQTFILCIGLDEKVLTSFCKPFVLYSTIIITVAI